MGECMDIEWVDPKWQNENIIINPFALYFGAEKRKKTKNKINKNYLKIKKNSISYEEGRNEGFNWSKCQVFLNGKCSLKLG